MDAIQINPTGQNEVSLRDSVTEVINSKIQKTDFELKNFVTKLQNPNQKPGRASDQDPAWIDRQKDVFDIIERSSKFTTKLLYLRARLTELNSTKVLHLISSSRLSDLTLDEIKEEIR